MADNKQASDIEKLKTPLTTSEVESIRSKRDNQWIERWNKATTEERIALVFDDAQNLLCSIDDIARALPPIHDMIMDIPSTNCPEFVDVHAAQRAVIRLVGLLDKARTYGAPIVTFLPGLCPDGHDPEFQFADQHQHSAYGAMCTWSLILCISIFHELAATIKSKPASNVSNVILPGGPALSKCVDSRLISAGKWKTAIDPLMDLSWPDKQQQADARSRLQAETQHTLRAYLRDDPLLIRHIQANERWGDTYKLAVPRNAPDAADPEPQEQKTESQDAANIPDATELVIELTRNESGKFAVVKKAFLNAKPFRKFFGGSAKTYARILHYVLLEADSSSKSQFGTAELEKETADYARATSNGRHYLDKLEKLIKNSENPPPLGNIIEVFKNDKHWQIRVIADSEGLDSGEKSERSWVFYPRNEDLR